MNTELEHTHVTFTIPGTIAKLLFERKYEPLQMMELTTSLYKSLLCSSAKVEGKEYQLGCMPEQRVKRVTRAGIQATLHKSGNSLNYNPHIHMIATKEFVNTLTGEIIDAPNCNRMK
jgi:hypothetical protein